MKNRNKNKSRRDKNGIEFSELLHPEGIFIVKSYWLKSGLEAVKQMHRQENEGYNIGNYPYMAMKLLYQFMIIAVRVFRSKLNILVIDFGKPEINEMKHHKCENNQAAPYHIPGYPRSICPPFIAHIANRACFFVFDLQDKSHYKMKNNSEDKYGLQYKLHQRIGSHKMRKFIKYRFTEHGCTINDKMLQ